MAAVVYNTYLLARSECKEQKKKCKVLDMFVCCCEEVSLINLDVNEYMSLGRNYV